jgi:hypothetical protein
MTIKGLIILPDVDGGYKGGKVTTGILFANIPSVLGFSRTGAQSVNSNEIPMEVILTEIGENTIKGLEKYEKGNIIDCFRIALVDESVDQKNAVKVAPQVELVYFNFAIEVVRQHQLNSTYQLKFSPSESRESNVKKISGFQHAEFKEGTLKDTFYVKTSSPSESLGDQLDCWKSGSCKGYA